MDSSFFHCGPLLFKAKRYREQVVHGIMESL